MREYGSEHPAIVLPDNYFKSLEEYDRDVLYLRSGREALLLAAFSASDKSEKVILLPAYCCWSMSAPFEKAGWSIVYYRLNEDLTVDVQYLKTLLSQRNPKAVLTMNYFGCASTELAVKIIKEYDEHIVVIEDFSHCTFSLALIFNPAVDIYVSSIRKSIGICDGAVILSSLPLKHSCVEAEESDFSDLRYVAQTEKRLYGWNHEQNKKQEFLKAIREGENIINSFCTVQPISERARRMLALVNGKDIRYARQKNMNHLMSLLEDKVTMVPNLKRSLDGAPFSLPILVEDRDVIQRKLAYKGVYAPVLWPICQEAQSVCSVSKLMGAHMLSIPIDQRYDWNDMEDIAERLLNVLISE